MKLQIITLLLLILLCGVAAAAPDQDITLYHVYGVVWDPSGNRAAGTSITLVFEDQTQTIITASDGSFVFPTMNFDGTEDGDMLTVSCEHGIKTVEINYGHTYMTVTGLKTIRQHGIGVTFNEPSQSEAIMAFFALGLIAIPIGNGIYRIFKRKKE